MTSYALDSIEGIDTAHVDAFKAAGITTTTALLEHAHDPKGRKELAATTGIDAALILRWANISDLLRIHGVGKEYSDLLEAAGVDTVKELKHRNAANLTKALAEANEKGNFVRALPSEKVVEKWIEEAKVLPPALTY
ncbi:DUF4332 domain-containing protein [Pseudochelatococcus contaminans]|uniref:Putative flap endonuclease-1-like 5' DNA nuclease n=1 Tax=Pseudochelatococcus contaminans TaxID=1538103 RepID=A0A7W6EHG8_9HYPH|nr:DUF4332 domain-containing protein [Pseudochelatococcus contaminans]MBB3809767.1 putative flap endonuclease-1-like 5' DNA nuclease [Pseudochelatococcus contaminans]